MFVLQACRIGDAEVIVGKGLEGKSGVLFSLMCLTYIE